MISLDSWSVSRYNEAMTFLDVVFLAFLFGFFWSGFKSGLIMAVGRLVGIVVGIVLAGRWYGAGAAVFRTLGAVPTVADILGFLAVFVIVTNAVGIAAWLANKAFNIVAIIPGFKLLNRIGGAFLGLVEGVLILGVTLNFAARLPEIDILSDALRASTLVPILIGASSWLVPLLPRAIREVRSLI